MIKEGTLLLYDKHNPIPEMEYIDYGICLYLKKLWRDYEDGEAFDISKIQKEQSILGKMAVHIVTKRFYEIGSQKSLEEFSEYVKGRFLNSRPCVFLDRDGVINEIVYNENIEQLDSPLKIEEFCLLEKVEEALQIIEVFEGYMTSIHFSYSQWKTREFKLKMCICVPTTGLRENIRRSFFSLKNVTAVSQSQAF